MNKHLWIIGLLFGLGACEPAAGKEGSNEHEPATGGEDDAGESGGGGTREAQLCQRAAECLYLEAGYTVGDCTDIVESCTDDLLTSAHADWNGWADDCLGLNNCMNFGACYESIDVCTLYVEVDVVESTGEIDPSNGDGGSEPPDPSGNDSGPSDDSSGGSEGGCGADAQACYDDWTIEACVDGNYYIVDCLDACLEGGWSDTLGCGYDAESGVDICFCE